MKRLLGLAAAVCLAAPLAAEAQPIEGIYIGVGGGLNYHEDSDIDGVRLGGEAEFDLGFAVMGVVGYGFGGPRVEGELSYRLNETDSSLVVNNGTSPILTRPSADITTLAGMLNVYYDIDTGTIWTPYLGGGIGIGYAEHKSIGSDVVFAYQAIVGGSINFGNNIEGFADYRYFGTTKIEGGDIGRAAEIENRSHVLMAGLRYNFGPLTEPAPVAYTPPPPAPPPPPVVRPQFTAPAPAVRAPAERRFLVFFDFDSSKVRTDGAQVIRDAAEASRTVAVTRIDVTGHADRAGSRRYNERLSRRRADAVKAELISNGVPEKDIIVYAKGELDNLVPTRDGVREPQNRRVEIVLN